MKQLLSDNGYLLLVVSIVKNHCQEFFDDLACPCICEIIIWKAQGVPQQNNVAHPKHPEEEETSPNRNHIITGKQQKTN